MGKEIIFTERAPRAVGPYSQAVKIDGWIYLSGQIPLEPGTNEVCKGTIEEQTRLVLTNAHRLLEAAGASIQHVVKVTLYVANMEEFGRINDVYAGFFAFDPPARSAVEVARLPKDVGIEIDMVAYVD